MTDLGFGENNFVMRIANVNGTGSASANTVLAKSFFHMGLTIGAKNMFPSNIKGMPTWFEIRVSDKGFTGRKGVVHLMVAMNGQSLQKDALSLCSNGYLLFDSSFNENLRIESRADVHTIPIPIAKLTLKNFSKIGQRGFLQNMIYVGACTKLLHIDIDVVKEVIEKQYAGNRKLIPLNLEALLVGWNYVEERELPKLPFYTAKKTENLPCKDILIDGNTCLALGSLYAGATVCGWYPITPSTSVVDAFSKYCKKFRTGENGEKKYAIMQAEDEISAIGMVLGASWNGSRAFTATSGPGISLMSEFLGFAFYSETPVVLFDIQRCGPATGMPTRTQQSDLLLCAYASHGDTKHMLLFPSDPLECFLFAYDAFNLAEMYQTPVIVLSDLEIGMNEFQCQGLDTIVLPPIQRGKVLSEGDLAQMQGPFYRYLDEEGDGIPYRTYPGVHPRGAYFTRGSGHDKYGRYTEIGEDYQENLKRIFKKFETALKDLPKPKIQKNHLVKQDQFALIYYGSSKEAVEEALYLLERENIVVDHLRICSFPFHEEIYDFIACYEKIAVVEQNFQGQMTQLLKIERPEFTKILHSICLYDGMPLEAESVARELKNYFVL